jgi:hypothetical protein
VDEGRGEAKAPFARRMRARYAFSGAGREIDRTLPLGPGETVLEDGSVSLRWGVVLQRRGSLRLSGSRLVVLGHHAFRPDQVTEIPAGALESIEGASLGWTRLTFRTANGVGSVDFRPLSLSPTFGASLQAWRARSRHRTA